MNALEQAIYAAATGAAALTALLASATAVYFQLAPQNATGPYVVFDFVSEVEDNKSPRRAKQLLYRIEGVVPDKQASGAGYTMKDAGLIDAQIDVVFHQRTLAVTGWTNTWSVRETGVRLTETADGGKRFFRAGGVYRFRLAT